MAFFVYGTLVFWIARVFNPNRSLDFRQIVRLCLAYCFTAWRWCSGLHRAKAGSKALAEVGKMVEEHPSCKRKCYFMRSDDRFGFNLLILKLMTSIKLKFRPSKVNGKLGTLYFQVIHDRLTRQIGTGYKVYSHEWGDGGLRLPPQGTERRSYLLGVQVRLRKDVERLRNIITRLQQSCESYTVVQIADIYKQPRSDSSKLGAFLNTTVRHLRKIGKVRLAETYTVMLNSLLRFRGEKGDVRWREIDTDLVKEYEYYLLEECGLELNTVSFYMRNLRAVYNRAVEKGLVEEKRFLFKHVYTGVRKTAKRAISPAIIQKIKTLDLSSLPALARSRDYFMLSFYLRGMSFVDLSYLKTSDLLGDHLHYHRQKTNQPLYIKWEEQMGEIVRRYHVPGSPYLLPIISKPGWDERRQYLNGLHRVNNHLKLIGQMVGCPIKLTTYCARHGKKAVGKEDFLSAVDRIIGGLEKQTKVMTVEEKQTIALHEAGHATISWFLQYANPLIKVTIVPRGRALGAAWYLPEERQITTKEQMLDEMCATLGGRAAEELFTGHISSGALNDLERVTKQAYSMIAYLGMSERLPNLCYYNNDEYNFTKPYSDQTAQLIDEEVKHMIAEQYERAKSLLREHQDGHAPHIPVPSTMIGFILTTVGIPSFFVRRHTNFIMIIGPMATHTSYFLP